nr:hypothetical protein [Ramlibacter lithotrophicus]
MAGGACAQAGCPAAADVAQQQLLGLWRAEFADGGAGATLLLEPHPEYPQSVRGAINRGGERALVAGDADSGEFTLEESVNGRNISAVWLGDVVEGSCGREIRGTWKAEGNPRTRAFVLRRQ